MSFYEMSVYKMTYHRCDNHALQYGKWQYDFFLGTAATTRSVRQLHQLGGQGCRSLQDCRQRQGRNALGQTEGKLMVA